MHEIYKFSMNVIGSCITKRMLPWDERNQHADCTFCELNIRCGNRNIVQEPKKRDRVPKCTFDRNYSVLLQEEHISKSNCRARSVPHVLRL